MSSITSVSPEWFQWPSFGPVTNLTEHLFWILPPFSRVRTVLNRTTWNHLGCCWCPCSPWYVLWSWKFSKIFVNISLSLGFSCESMKLCERLVPPPTKRAFPSAFLFIYPCFVFWLLHLFGDSTCPFFSFLPSFSFCYVLTPADSLTRIGRYISLLEIKSCLSLVTLGSTRNDLTICLTTGFPISSWTCIALSALAS